MPRKYILKKWRPTPLSELIRQCIKAIEDEAISIREAGRRFNVEEFTIRAHRPSVILGVPQQTVGRLPCIPLEVSADLPSLIRKAAQNGFSFSVEEIRMSVVKFIKGNWNSNHDLGHYLRVNCRFKEFIPVRFALKCRSNIQKK
jgi:hypothetical protein